MKVITGDELGLVKVCSIEKKKCVQKFGTHDREQSVKTVCFCDCFEGHKTEGLICVILKNGLVQIWNAVTGDVVANVGSFPDVVSAVLLTPSADISHENLPFSSDPFFVVCTKEGSIHLIHHSAADRTFEKYFQVPGPVEKCLFKPNSEKDGFVFAIGGKENDLKLFSLDKKEEIWKAKNLPHDALQLRPPVWIRDIVFVPSDYEKMIVATHYGEVKVFNPGTKRRPLYTVPISDLPISCLTLPAESTGISNTVFIADHKGGVKGINIKTGVVCAVYKGNAGSVRALATHPTQPYLAAVGLDRFLRVYDIKTRLCVAKIYLKQHLNTCLFSAELLVQGGEKRAREGSNVSACAANNAGESDLENDDGDDDEKLWVQMLKMEDAEEKKEPQVKKRKKAVSKKAK